MAVTNLGMRRSVQRVIGYKWEGSTTIKCGLRDGQMAKKKLPMFDADMRAHTYN